MQSEPVSHENCTVNGVRVGLNDTRWTGLDFSRAELRFATWLVPQIADVHLHVPWKHPLDARYDEGIYYRVRARNKRHRLEFLDGGWVITKGECG
jgi:hypothetical protein